MWNVLETPACSPWSRPELWTLVPSEACGSHQHIALCPAHGKHLPGALRLVACGAAWSPGERGLERGTISCTGGAT